MIKRFNNSGNVSMPKIVMMK